MQAVIDAPVALLLEALDAVRGQPAPAGQAAARLSVLAHAAKELEGVHLRELAAVDPVAEGVRSPADLLVDAAGLPAWQARSDDALARRLAVLPGLLDAVAGGGLELAAARQLARAWSALPEGLRDAATAQALVALGGLVDLPDLRSEVDELVAALQPEVTDEAVAAARESGGLVLTDVGAETRLVAHTDVLTGEWLREVLEAKAEADRGLLDGRTSDARLLDALLDVVRTSVGTSAVPGGPGPDGGAPTLVVVATPDDLARAATHLDGPAAPDVVPAEDALADLLAPLRSGPVTDTACRGVTRPRWSARTRAGTHLGPRSLLGLTCGAHVSRLLLDAAGHPVDSTPAARQRSRRERRALELRAAYRCERAGCGRPARTCVPHHVVPWSRGGPSTLANTALLCRSCHHLLHDRLRPLLLNGARRTGAAGWLSGGPPGS